MPGTERCCFNVSALEDDTKLLDHAWRYFELHAKQRLTLFNFFVVLSGLIAAAWGTAMTAEEPLPTVGAIMGIVLAFSSIIFWKLDQRNAFLTKRAESLMAKAEERLFQPDDCLFGCEDADSQSEREGYPILRQWSHGESLRIVFVIMGLAGILGAGYSIWPARPAGSPIAPTLISPPPAAQR